MKVSYTLKHACEVLRRRVQYTDAGLTLPGNYINSTREDTEAIREATRLYVDSWILPIIDAIESGDTKTLREFTQHDRGTPMEE
jgi:hypothetical protein